MNNSKLATEKNPKVTIGAQDNRFTNLPNTFHNFKIISCKLRPLMCLKTIFNGRTSYGRTPANI